MGEIYRLEITSCGNFRLNCIMQGGSTFQQGNVHLESNHSYRGVWIHYSKISFTGQRDILLLRLNREI
jgi:hypothetical protein